MRGFGVLKLASVLPLVVSGSVYAADLPMKAAPMAVPVAYNWTGIYIGGNIGGKWGDFDTPIAIGATPVTAASTLGFGGRPSSFIGGGQIGFNWQFNQLVWGIEADSDAQRLRQSATIVTTGTPFLFRAGDSFDARSDWQSFGPRSPRLCVRSVASLRDRRCRVQ